MDGSIVILFYSRYSKRCNEFFNLIKNTTIDIRKISVDSKEVKQILLNESEKYNIRSVPTILVFYPNGVLHKYEEAQVFEWASTLLKPALEPTYNVFSIPQEKSEPIEVQHIEEEDLKGMKRRIETTPLFNNKSIVEEERVEKKTQKNENIKNLAQMLQAEREKEDEHLNPNAVSKVNFS